MMTSDEKNEIQKRLESLKRDILAKTTARLKPVALGSTGCHVSGDAGDSLDSAQGEQVMGVDFEVKSLLSREEFDSLEQIELALAKLSLGSYGYCFDCGNRVSHKRLLARPFAKRCKDCQETYEMACRNIPKGYFGT